LAVQSIQGWPDQYNNWARALAENPAAFQPLTAPPPGVIGLQNNPRMMNLPQCDDFVLYRIQLRNSPNFHVSYSGGDGFTVWGIIINTPKAALNGDGIPGPKCRATPPTSPLPIATFTPATITSLSSPGQTPTLPMSP
jgi:hypothetical protein